MSDTEVLTPKNLGGLQVSPVVDAALPFINQLIYGPSGIGKTVLAGSASVVPEMRPVIYLDVEGGTLSLRERYPDVERVRIKSVQDLTKVHHALATTDHGYKTVVLDSITETQQTGMHGPGGIMQAAIQKDSDRDPDLPGIGEYGKSTQMMRKIIRAFRDLPMNTIFTSLDRVERVKGREFIKPSLTAKLSDEIAGFLDLVVYLYKKEGDDGEVNRYLLSVATDTVTAKDRTDKLPPVLINPTMEDIYDIAIRHQNESTN
jgi:hypothetical protein